jgi:hypothetical protein
MTADFSLFILLLVVKQWLNTLNMLLLWLLYMFLLWILTGFLTRFSWRSAACSLCLLPRVNGLWQLWGRPLLIVAGGKSLKIFGSKNGKSGGEGVNTS